MNQSDAQHERRPLQTTILLVSLVVGIVVGLLAMHTLESTMGMHGASVSSNAMMANAQSASLMGSNANTVIAAPCDVSCAPDTTMSLMACILALLLTALLLAAAAKAAMTALLPLRTPRASMLSRLVNTGRPPPDLTRLSISRT